MARRTELFSRQPHKQTYEWNCCGQHVALEACCVALAVSIARRLGKDLTLVAEKLQCAWMVCCGPGRDLTFGHSSWL